MLGLAQKTAEGRVEDREVLAGRTWIPPMFILLCNCLSNVSGEVWFESGVQFAISAGILF